MEKDPQRPAQRKKREVAVAPRSGAQGYRLTAWALTFVSLSLVALVYFKVTLVPGDTLFPLLFRTLLFLAPPIGAASGVVAFVLSKTTKGRVWAAVPFVFLVLFWLWLIWELMEN